MTLAPIYSMFKWKVETAYQNINSTAHFVVDVVVCFSDSSVIKEPGKELRNSFNKWQANTTELLIMAFIAK